MMITAQHGIGHQRAQRGRLARAGRADRGDMHGFVVAAEGNAREGDAAGCPRPETPEPSETECPDFRTADMARPPWHRRESRTDRPAEESEGRGHHPRRRPAAALQIAAGNKADPTAADHTHPPR